MESELNGILSKSALENRKIINYKDCMVYDKYEHIADYIENFEVREDDVWVCTFPKSGTTWMQEMVWAIANDLDSKRAQLSIDLRFPFFELPSWNLKKLETIVSKELTKMYNLDQDLQYIEIIAKLPSPRFIKTHLPFHLLPLQLREGEKKNCKIVYVSRNPKDTCISSYHFYSSFLKFFDGTFEEFCKLFMNDKVMFGPYWNHVNGYQGKKDKINILCTKFEDMKNDLRSEMEKVAIFLGKKLNDEQLKRLEYHLSFANMKKNPAVNRESHIGSTHAKNEEDGKTVAKFMRSGEVNQWKTEMSKKLAKQFDDWVVKSSKNF